MMGKINDPQTWNRYVYVRDNPVNSVDPSGQGFLSWLMKAFIFLGEALIGVPQGPGIGGWPGTPPIFGGDPISGTQATLSSIYNPPDLSKFGISETGGMGFTADPNQGVTVPADKPWDMRGFLVTLLRGDNPCSKWLDKGKNGSAADILSNIQINLIYPGNGKVPVVNSADAWVEHSNYGTVVSGIGVARYGRYYDDGPSGIDVEGFNPGTTGARAIILLHELAHVVNVGDFIDNDALTPGASETNTQTVGTHCHSAILHAIAATVH